MQPSIFCVARERHHTLGNELRPRVAPTPTFRLMADGGLHLRARGLFSQPRQTLPAGAAVTKASCSPYVRRARGLVGHAGCLALHLVDIRGTGRLDGLGVERVCLISLALHLIDGRSTTLDGGRVLGSLVVSATAVDTAGRAHVVVVHGKALPLALLAINRRDDREWDAACVIDNGVVAHDLFDFDLGRLVLAEAVRQRSRTECDGLRHVGLRLPRGFECFWV